MFSDGPRADHGVRKPEESVWGFLDRVDDPAFARVRSLLNNWFAQYPSEGRVDLRGRLASGDDRQFHSAWFELYLYALHRALGFELRAHPEVNGVTTRPDFRIVQANELMLLEATVLGDSDKAGRAARRSRVVAAIERIDSPDFSLHFHIAAETDDAPPMRDVRRRVERWLADLDWDVVRQRLVDYPGLDAPPVLTAHASGWKFRFRAWPRDPKRRGTVTPTISAGPSSGGVFDHSAALRGRLEEKAKKYGSNVGSMVVAIRCDGMGVHDDDIASALHGPRIGVFDSATTRVRPAVRRGDGLWHRDGAIRNQHVVGVLAFGTELRPWSVTRQRPTLWLAPGTSAAATFPYDTVALGAGGLERRTGTFDPADIFDLPDGAEFPDRSKWPGEAFAHLRE